MHLDAKRIATLGLMLAITEILVILASVLSFNTLIILVFAAFMTGFVVNEFGLYSGLAFGIAGVLLAFILSPQKMYCLTYGAMSFYIFVTEAVWRLLQKLNVNKKLMIFWVVRYVVFNCIYIPTIIFIPKLVFNGDLSDWMYIGIIAGGQVLLPILEQIYSYLGMNVHKLFKNLA